MRHPELKQLYDAALSSEDLISDKDKDPEQLLNKVIMLSEKPDHYSPREKEFINLCLDYNEKKKELHKRLVEMKREISVTTRK